MNQQNERYFPPVPPLIESFNLVLTADELDYLLLMKTNRYTYEQAAALSKMPQDKFNVIFEALRAKGFIKTEYTANGEERYILHAIVVGWIEAQVPWLVGKPEEKAFAETFHNNFITYWSRFNHFPFRTFLNSMSRRTFKSNQSVGFNALKGKTGRKTLIKYAQKKADPFKGVCLFSFDKIKSL